MIRALVALLLLNLGQPASPEEQAAAVARPAIVHITTSWQGWVRDKRTGEIFGGVEGYKLTSSCSGAVINGDGYVATAAHCVDRGVDGGGGGLLDMAVAELTSVGRVRDQAKARQQLAENAVIEGAKTDSPIGRRIQVERMTERGRKDIAPATVVDMAAPLKGDVAVLKVPRRGLPALEVATDEAAVGTPILAIGYPASTDEVTDPTLEPSNKNGQISSHRTQDGQPYLEISAAVTHGMSGGPVVDTQGRLVGVISQLSPGESQSFNLAAEARTLTRVLRGKRVEARLGAPDRDYRTGLKAYYDGDYDTAFEYMDAVMAAAPNPQAKRFRDLAAERGGSAGGGNGVLVVLIAVSAGIAVLSGVAGFVLAARQRRAAMAAPTPPYGFPIPQSPTTPSS
jgi:S1-C subfamily serine protease